MAGTELLLKFAICGQWKGNLYSQQLQDNHKEYVWWGQPQGSSYVDEPLDCNDLSEHLDLKTWQLHAVLF